MMVLRFVTVRNVGVKDSDPGNEAAGWNLWYANRGQ
jgi:hypothetical protein